MIDEIFAEDVIDHSPLGEKRGSEALKEEVGYLHAAFADASATVEEAVAEDDTVVLRVTVRGRREMVRAYLTRTNCRFHRYGLRIAANSVLKQTREKMDE